MSRALSRAARLRELETLLFRAARGMRVIDLANRLEVDRRTIYRDIELLQDSDVPIWEEDGRYGVLRDQYLATVRLRFQEAVVLYIAARLLARHTDEHNPAIVSALTKLATAFPEPLASQVSRTADLISRKPEDPAFTAILEDVALAWAEGRKITLLYRGVGSERPRERTVSPYLIEPSQNGGLYLIGHDEDADAIRTFKLERITETRVTADHYDLPAGFDIASYLANAWGIMGGSDATRVVLRFSPAVTRYIAERIWHPSQHIEVDAQGFVTLTFFISDDRELHPWIRSWGAEVEVLEPPALRGELAEQANRLISLYQEKGAPL